MDIGTVVAWLQMAIWIVVGLAWGTRIMKTGNLPTWLKFAGSNKFLALVVFCGIAMSSWSLYVNYAQKPNLPNAYWPSGAEANKPLKQVRQKTFDHETVPLDGYEYIDCTFNDVTFEFEGRSGCGLPGSHLVAITPDGKSTYRLKSKNPVVILALQFAQWSGVGQVNPNNPWGNQGGQ
jgi:hypothetical protein